MGRLKGASVAVRNAVFDAVYNDLDNDIRHWDSMWRNLVLNQLESQTGRQLILAKVDVAIEAYEKAVAIEQGKT